MPPLARVRTELGVGGWAGLALGAVGLSGALVRGTQPARALVPFVVVALLLFALQSAMGGRWLRHTARSAPTAPPDRSVEPPDVTVRRSLVATGLTLVAVLAAVLFSRGLGAVVGAVAAGVGGADLWSARWARAWERAGGTALLREVPRSPFAGGRRPLYTRPASDSTLAT